MGPVSESGWCLDEAKEHRQLNGAPRISSTCEQMTILQLVCWGLGAKSGLPLLVVSSLWSSSIITQTRGNQQMFACQRQKRHVSLHKPHARTKGELQDSRGLGVPPISILSRDPSFQETLKSPRGSGSGFFQKHGWKEWNWLSFGAFCHVRTSTFCQLSVAQKSGTKMAPW